MKLAIHHHTIAKFSLLLVGVIVITAVGWWASQTFFMNKQVSKTPQPSVPTRQDVTPAFQHPSTPAPQASSATPPMIPNYTIPPVQNGMAPVITRIPTDLPVVYLGIDDGANKTQAEIDLLAKNNIKASLFLSDLFIASNPGFFKPIIAQGSVVENHTLSHHTRMVNESYAFQKQDICGMSDKIQRYYGRRPTLFRPPGGAYSDSLRRAAYECGMKAVVTWIAKANGGSMQYQVGNRLRPGDIVLMHFRPEFEQDLNAFVTAMNASGLHTELLETLPGAL